MPPNSKTQPAFNASSVPYPSKYEITKSYGGFQNFMASYGLKFSNDDEVQEANAIVEGLQQSEYQRRVDDAKKQWESGRR